jgi:hypothetical protein
MLADPVAKFFAAEVTLTPEYLHTQNIIYRSVVPGYLHVQNNIYRSVVPGCLHVQNIIYRSLKRLRTCCWTATATSRSPTLTRLTM